MSSNFHCWVMMLPLLKYAKGALKSDCFRRILLSFRLHSARYLMFQPSQHLLCSTKFIHTTHQSSSDGSVITHRKAADGIFHADGSAPVRSLFLISPKAKCDNGFKFDIISFKYSHGDSCFVLWLTLTVHAPFMPVLQRLRHDISRKLDMSTIPEPCTHQIHFFLGLADTFHMKVRH